MDIHLYILIHAQAASSITKEGLKIGKDEFVYRTDKGDLSALQAQIELALPASRSLPTSIIKVDAAGLKPLIIRRVVGNLTGYGAGGGTQYLFNHNISASLITKIK